MKGTCRHSSTQCEQWKKGQCKDSSKCGKINGKLPARKDYANVAKQRSGRSPTKKQKSQSRSSSSKSSNGSQSSQGKKSKKQTKKAKKEQKSAKKNSGHAPKQKSLPR